MDMQLAANLFQYMATRSASAQKNWNILLGGDQSVLRFKVRWNTIYSIAIRFHR